MQRKWDWHGMLFVRSEEEVPSGNGRVKEPPARRSSTQMLKKVWQMQRFREEGDEVRAMGKDFVSCTLD